MCSVNEQHIGWIPDLEVPEWSGVASSWPTSLSVPAAICFASTTGTAGACRGKSSINSFGSFTIRFKPSGEKIEIDELVFFGRLETRKGLWLFCEALDRLSDRLRGKTVTFLGKTTDAGISSGLQLLIRSTKWPFRVRLLTDYDRDEAIAYLKQGDRLAVMPSLADNSPCVIHECIEARVPSSAHWGAEFRSSSIPSAGAT